MADREFIGGDWFNELVKCHIPFYIRIRNNMKVVVPGKGEKKAFWLFNHLKNNHSMHYEGLVYIGENLVYLSGVKTFIKSENRNETLIIASFTKQDQAVINYKERWQIETMFRAMKTSGFNLEDTHLTDLERISKLIAMISIAFVWVYRIGLDKHMKIKKIKIKKHGRMAFSFFKYGLIRLAHAILNSLDFREFEKCIKILSFTLNIFTFNL